MRTIGPLGFLVLSARSLGGGVGLALHMGLRQDFGVAPVHGRMALMGRASFAPFGLTWRVWPDIGGRRSAWLHLLRRGRARALLFGLAGELSGPGAAALLFLGLVLRRFVGPARSGPAAYERSTGPAPSSRAPMS